MADEGLEAAVKLVREGKMKEARELLEGIVQSEVHNVPAWFWYAKTCSSPAERMQVLQTCLRFNPDDLDTQKVLGLLPDHARGAPQDPSQQGQQSPVIKRLDANAGSKPPASKVSTQLEPGSGANGKAQKSRASNWYLLGSAVLLLIFCVGAGLIAYNSLPQDPAKYRHAGPVEYFLYVPRKYTPEHEWPLFVGIHGSGGTGLDCWNWWQAYADREGFILLCPSIADSGGGWYQADGEAKVFSAINQVRANYRVRSQEFLAGFSAGAQFVQGFAIHNPQYVSGIAILSAGNYYDPAYIPAGIPILVVIGDRDDPGAVETSAGFAAGLKQNGLSVQYEVLPGIGHALTNRGQQLTVELFRKTQGK